MSSPSSRSTAPPKGHTSSCPVTTRTPVRIFGLPLDPLDVEETLVAIEKMIECGCPHQHVVLNAAKVVAAQDDGWLTDVIERCDLVNADGMAVVWAARLLGHRVPERVAGVDLMIELLRVAVDWDRSVYFLGAREDVVREVVARARQEHPQLRVAGFRNGYWDPDEDAAVAAAVREAVPDIVFVAIPSPRKEHFLAEHLEALGASFAMGVGGSFDVYAGQISRAPVWMQRLGLEWLHRMAREPRRMARRYIVGNSRFMWLTLRSWIASR